MWRTAAWWEDSLWRAFRTFCQTLAGLLVTLQVTDAFHAPWTTILGASALSALLSLLMSVDRSTSASPAVVVDPPVALAALTPVEPVPAHELVTVACGTNLR